MQTKKPNYLLIGIVSVAVIACCALGGIALAAHGSDTPTAQRSPSPTMIATVKAALKTPTIGGTLAAFAAKYGQISKLPAGYVFYLDAGHTINVILSVQGGRITVVSVAGPPSWTATQSLAACAPFLPSGAKKTGGATPFIDFQSSVGEIIENVGDASCTLTLG
jgi:hypothetical protein